MAAEPDLSLSIFPPSQTALLTSLPYVNMAMCCSVYIDMTAKKLHFLGGFRALEAVCLGWVWEKVAFSGGLGVFTDFIWGGYGKK